MNSISRARVGFSSILFFVLLLGVVATTMAAKISPLTFGNDATDDATWKRLVQYKLWATGPQGILIRSNAHIPDSTGFVGSAKGGLEYENTKHSLGGPLIFPGNFTVYDGLDTIVNGPSRFASMRYSTTENNWTSGGYSIKGKFCLTNGGSCPRGVTCSCDGVYAVDSDLQLPSVVNNFSYDLTINNISANNNIAYIDVPDVAPDEDGNKKPYNIHITGDITFQNEASLLIRMPYNGRSTRIIVDGQMKLSSRSHIQVIYAQETDRFADGHWPRSSINDAAGVKEYAGDVLFYLKKGLANEALTPGVIVEGTYIIPGTVTVSQHFSFAGQILADRIIIDHDFNSEFRYVPFEGPKVNTALAEGGLTEGEGPQNINFSLTEAATVNVTVKYCFEFDPTADENTLRSDKPDVVSYAHRNDIANENIPLCEENNYAYVSFKKGQKVPETPVYLEAMDDEILENRESFKIYIEATDGAVLKVGGRSGWFDIYINDNDNGIPISHDSTIVASAGKDTIGYEDKGFLITSFPAYVEDKDGKEGKALDEYKVFFVTLPKGILGYHGHAVAAGDTIPSADLKNGDLQYRSDLNDYGDSVKNFAYTSFQFLILNKNDSVAKAAKTMSIEMRPVNDAPFFVYIGTNYKVGAYDLNNNTFVFKENAPVDSVIATAVALDSVDMNRDSKATLTYSLVKASSESGYTDIYTSGDFKIDSKTGKISVAKALNYNRSNKYKGRIVVTDNGVPGDRKNVLKDTIEFYITLVEIKKPPEIVANPNDTVAYVKEHAPIGTVLMEYKATDENKGDKLNLLFTLEAADGSSFSDVKNLPFGIVSVSKSDSAYVYVKEDIDYETMKDLKFRFRVIVSDDSLESEALFDTTFLTIYIRDVNENPVVADKFAFQVSSEESTGYVVGTVKAEDLDIEADPRTVLTYEMGTVYDVTGTKREMSGLFDINASTGEIFVKNGDKLTAALQECVFEAEVTVTDNGSKQKFCMDSLYLADAANGRLTSEVKQVCYLDKNLSSKTIVTISVPKENFEPKFDSSKYEFSVKENSPAGTVLGEVSAKDKNPNDVLVFSIDDKTNSLPFEIVNGTNKATIRVKNNVVIDFEKTNQYKFNVVVTDGAATATAPVTVTVIDVNEKPTIESAEFSVKEHSKKGTVVGNVKVTDVDTWTKMTYALRDSTKDASKMFSIAPAATCEKGFYCGEISVAADELNFEKEQLYIVWVKATDNGKEYGLPPSMSDSTIVKIHVIDENDTPKFDVDDYKFAVDENSPLYTFVGEVHASDEDPKDTITYSLIEITAGASDIFELDELTGKIQVAKAVLDYEKLAEYKFKVVATDNGNPVLKDTATMTITVNNVNEKPNLTKSQQLKVDEWTPIGTVIGTVTSSDLDTNAAFMKHKYFAVAGDTLLFTIDSLTGKVSVRDTIYDATDAINSYVLDIRVVDYSTDSLLFDHGEVEIILNQANNPPRITPATYYVFENSVEGDFVGDVDASDDNTAYDKLKFEIVGGSDEFEISVKYNGRITVKAGANIDYETKTGYIITIRATDEEDAFSEREFRVLVRDINEPPVLKDTVFTIAENTKAGGLVGRIHAFDAESPESDLIFALDSGFVSDEFELSSTGNIRVKKGVVLDYEVQKAYTLKVKVTDPEGLFDVGEVPINIENVNEAPVFEKNEFHVVENSPEGTFVGQLVAHDAEDADDELVYALVGSSMEFKVARDGKITVLKGANLDYETKHEYTIDVSVRDAEGLLTKGTALIHIDDVREPPSLNDTIFHVEENVPKGTPVGVLVGNNPEKDTLKYKLITTSEKFKVREDGTIVTIGEIDYEEQKVYKLKVVLIGDSCTDTATVTINVDNIIEKPKVKITRAEDGDSVWVKPDTIYTNKKKIDFEWTVDNKFRPDTLANFPGNGTYTFSLCYDDPTMDMPGCDTVIVKIDNSLPKVKISKDAEDTSAISGVTIVEQVDEKDTNFYVNHEDNVIRIGIVDKAMGVDSTFEVDLRLDTLTNTKKALEKIKKLSKTEITLEDAENAQTRRIMVNDNTYEVSFKKLIGDDTVTVVYYTDKNGKTIKNSDGDVVMRVSFDTEIGDKAATVSYNVNGKTGEVIENENGGTYEFFYSYTDDFGGLVGVRYSVDEKGKFAKTEAGDYGFQVSYTYKNRFGNTGTKNIMVVLDKIVPVVEILSPENKLVVRTSGIDVKWTVDGDVQDTLVIQGLKNGLNKIIRTYRDKAGNEASDTVEVILKSPKELDVHVEKPVTIVSEDSVRKYYETNPPKKGQSFAVSMYNPYTEQEVETLIGGTFGKKTGSKQEPYPGMDGHLGPTLLFDALAPRCGENPAGGLCTLDDLIERDGMISLEAGGGWDRKKVSVEKYVEKYCSDDFRKEYKNDPKKASIYNTRLKVSIWIYTNIGGFLDEYHFTQEVNDPDYVNSVGEVNMAFELKPDMDGNVLSANGRLLGTGAYIFNTEVKSVSELRCQLPDGKVGEKRYVSDALRKSFGYKRPDMTKKANKKSGKSSSSSKSSQKK